MPNYGPSYIGINRHGSSIITNIRGGYHIFNIDPLRLVFSEKNGKYSITEMLDSSSLIAVVGNGEDPAYSTRQLLLINLVNLNCICRLTYATTIIWVRITVDQLIVSLTDRIYIYRLCNMKLLHVIEGLCIDKNTIAISYNLKNKILVYPICKTTHEKDVTKKRNHIYNIADKNESFDTEISPKHILKDTSIPTLDKPCENSFEFSDDDLDVSPHNNDKDVTGDVLVFDLNSLQPYLVIEAHKRRLQVLTLSDDGSLLATASKLGTIIRVFKVSTGERICQFRRGRYPTTIKCISFSKDNKYLIVASSSHRIHIFSIKQGLHALIDSKTNNVYNMSIDSKTNRSINLTSTLESDEEDFVIVPDEIQSIKYPRNMKELLKLSSRAITEEASKKFSKYFTDESTSTQVPRRHVAFCKIPNDIKTSPAVVFMGDIDRIRKDDYLNIYSPNLTPNKSQQWIDIRRVYLINEDGCFLVYIFDPSGDEECTLCSKLLLFNTE